MLIENKENYILISLNEKSFSDFYNSFLEKKEDIQDKHTVIQFSNEINIKKEDFLLFLNIAEQKKENGTSFVIINNKVNVDDFPEYFNIVPTLIEAEDILEMEAIERELGF